MVSPMRRIEGQRVWLVPYEREHVPRYHAWLQDPQLLQDTASDPLSLADQYDLQKSWSSDPSKCMFIILDKDRLDGGCEPGSPCIDEERGVVMDVAAMAGDVNIFINDLDDQCTAELNIMIAEPLSCGKGLAKEAVRLMIDYASQNLEISTIRVKIEDSNAASLHLFHELGFQDVADSDVFKQATLELFHGINQKGGGL